ncbi:ATP phosphoribosyltransferase regulatory subunit [Streptomyces sp. SL13]|uniref:Histidyl-tRNA synthetase n=1 Tax=Streptantibioticus silvisoli TaxID=2705255 RepID=A0AA90KG32_9ACTN|nr:ATP phosphoribosyltransferase regulatory subunit [Streptantibioticus silvisoli]MDI5963972.1 ATP phosphoribosyltransferase regulatory subunit [Streptantibioticus silvisoli]MDI5970065.1 ATP phosphoribosyltransferase regulatory subunit [Streptantibioticus silvisoli]
MLPPGFKDVVGEDAERINSAEALFLEVASTFGYAQVRSAPLSYVSDYLTFGSAAAGRIFDFVDRGGRHVALTANALVALLRAVSGADALRPAEPTLVAAAVTVARHQRKPLRSWTQLVATMCNEPDEFAAQLTMLRLWAALLAGTGCVVTLRDHRVVDTLADECGLGATEARDILHRWRKGEEPAGDAAQLCDRLSRLSKIDHDQPVTAQLREVTALEPALTGRGAQVDRVMRYLDRVGLPCRLDWNLADVTEYRSDLCFEITDPGGQVVAEGGGYHALAGGLGTGASTCWSTAGSAERMAALLAPSGTPMVHLLDLQCADDDFFLAAAAALRRSGYRVRERWGVTRLGNVLSHLPVTDESWFAVVGPQECAGRTLTLQHSARTAAPRQLTVPLTNVEE